MLISYNIPKCGVEISHACLILSHSSYTCTLTKSGACYSVDIVDCWLLYLFSSTSWLLFFFSFELFYILSCRPFISDYTIWLLLIVDGHPVTYDCISMVHAVLLTIILNLLILYWPICIGFFSLCRTLTTLYPLYL